MGSFSKTRVDTIEFDSNIQHGLPLAIDDMSLAHHMGIRNSTLWALVRQNDIYYNTFSLEKRGKSKGRRDIQDPKPVLKNVQRVLLAKFLAPVSLGKHVGAYVLGRSCMNTAQQHLGSGIIISMDIRNFFPSIRRSMIRRVLAGFGYNHVVASLLASLMTYHSFVPQGAPTSGMIANLVADQFFDQAIMADLQEFDSAWTYTRYSDDIDISHPQWQPEEITRQVILLVMERIESAGWFRLHPGKTRLEPYWRQQRILGIVVNETPNIPRYQYNQLRCMVHNSLVHGFKNQYVRAGIKNEKALVSHIRGKLNWLKQVNPEKADQLGEKFELAVKIWEEAPDEVQF